MPLLLNSGSVAIAKWGNLAPAESGTMISADDQLVLPPGTSFFGSLVLYLAKTMSIFTPPDLQPVSIPMTHLTVLEQQIYRLAVQQYPASFRTVWNGRVLFRLKDVQSTNDWDLPQSACPT